MFVMINVHNQQRQLVFLLLNSFPQCIHSYSTNNSSKLDRMLFTLLLCDFLAEPFTDVTAENSVAGAKKYVHLRVQQHNGRKSLTTKEFSYCKILKELKKEFCCDGTVVQDPELGQVIQVQRDQRKNSVYFHYSGWKYKEGTHKDSWI